MAPKVAAHRKPRQRTASGNTARTAATIALAGAATATGFDGTLDTPNRSSPPARSRPRWTSCTRRRRSPAEKYNGAKKKADAAGERIKKLQDQAARKEERLNSARDALGSVAAAQYRDGGIDPALRLACPTIPTGTSRTPSSWSGPATGRSPPSRESASSSGRSSSCAGPPTSS
ncbi:hypothetical protein SPURM210S_06315 [Streptomyces purpurascens]